MPSWLILTKRAEKPNPDRSGKVNPARSNFPGFYLYFYFHHTFYFNTERIRLFTMLHSVSACFCMIANVVTRAPSVVVEAIGLLAILELPCSTVLVIVGLNTSPSKLSLPMTSFWLIVWHHIHVVFLPSSASLAMAFNNK